MLPYVFVCLTALLVAALTLFSGFGLGTLLFPAFALFFPLEVAVAATAIVHLANNLLKLGLMGRHASRPVVVRFAIPAVIFALLGAWLLSKLSHLPPVATYTFAGREHTVTIIGLALAAIIAGFAVLELLPRLEKMAFPPAYLPLGGAISGFFGGLSGHQGALRSAFLARARLSKEAFIGTGVVCAVIVDCTRLPVYAVTLFGRDWALLQQHGGVGLVVAATLSAFAGTFIGTRLLQKVTLRAVRAVVGGMLLLVALLLAAGLV